MSKDSRDRRRQELETVRDLHNFFFSLPSLPKDKELGLRSKKEASTWSGTYRRHLTGVREYR